MTSEVRAQVVADGSARNLFATVSTQHRTSLTLSALGARPWHSTLFKDKMYEAFVHETKLQVGRATLGVTQSTGLRL